MKKTRHTISKSEWQRRWLDGCCLLISKMLSDHKAHTPSLYKLTAGNPVSLAICTLYRRCLHNTVTQPVIFVFPDNI